MSGRSKQIIPYPEEDLGRGGDASTAVPAGPPGEREELARDRTLLPDVRGTHQQEQQPLPPSAGR